MNILIFDSKTHTIKFRKEAYGFLPSFRTLMTKRYRCVGDPSGTKKLRNNQILIYIFHVADWTEENVYAALSHEEREQKARVVSGLPAQFAIDEVTENCIKEYDEIQRRLSPEAAIVISIKRQLYESAAYYEGLSSQTKQYTKAKTGLTEQLTGDHETDLPILQSIATLDDFIQKNMTNAAVYTERLEKAMSKLETMEQKLRSTSKDLGILIGGGKLHNRED